MNGQNKIVENGFIIGARCYWLILCCYFFVGLVGCGDEGPEQLLRRAEVMAADSTQLDQVEDLYVQFIERFPQHERAPEALKKQAVILQQQGKMQDAIDVYNILWRNYPDNEYGAEAYFMIAFICEEYLQDYDKARDFYQRVIERYPDSELGESAKQLLPHGGRPPEEWVKFQDG